MSKFIKSIKSDKSRYKFKNEELARGATGSISVAYDRILKKDVIIKKYLRENHQKLGYGTVFEIMALKKLKHPNVIEMYDIFICPDSLCISLEKMDANLSQLLANVLDDDIYISYLENSDNKKKMIKDIAKGIQYIHDSNILHTDIKGDNILFRLSDQKTVITDFGHSIEMNPHINEKYADNAFFFVPPEKLYHQMYSELEFESVWDEECQYPDIEEGLPTYTGGNNIPMENYVVGCIFFTIIYYGSSNQLWQNSLVTVNEDTEEEKTELKRLRQLRLAEISGDYTSFLEYYGPIPKGMEEMLKLVFKIFRIKPEERELDLHFITNEYNDIEKNKMVYKVKRYDEEVVKGIRDTVDFLVKNFRGNDNVNRVLLTNILLYRRFKDRHQNDEYDDSDIKSACTYIACDYDNFSVGMKMNSKIEKIVYDILINDIINTSPHNHSTNPDMLRKVIKFAARSKVDINMMIDELGGKHNNIKYSLKIENVFKSKKE